MTRKLLCLAAGAAVLWAAGGVFAQDEVELATRSTELQELSELLFSRDELDRRQVRDAAARAGIPVRRELPGGRVLEWQRLVPGVGPIFYVTNNLDAADTVSTDEVRPGGSAGLDLDGAGMIVGEWDGGDIYSAHPDFTDRLVDMDPGTAEVSGHSTHVAGTLIGAGDWLEPRSRGMAYAAQLNAWDWNSDTAEMAAAAATGLLISNHSYGIAAGWLYIGGVAPDEWWWIGGEQPSDIEDPNFGYYDTESQLWDQIAHDAPYYLVVKAAGNDRSDIGPAPGEEYWVIDQDGNFLFTSTLPRNPDCWPAGYDCLPTNSVAKNVLTVGAADDVPGGYSPLSGPSQVQMAPFSSWGPSDDGRIKPDLVGNGVFLISAWPDSPYYAAAAGTSMAAPNVTGSLLLLQEHYEDRHGAGNYLRAATLKALAIHTADEAGAADGPDYAFGWGLLNTRSAAEVITGDGGGGHLIVEASLANGTTDTVPINVADADSVVTATLVWMDPPGTPVAPSLDPPDLMLVNDLDLRVTRNAATYLPWVLDPAAPAAAATKGDNFRDNVEQVEIAGAAAGNYTIEISHKGTLLNGLDQDYALIVSVKSAPPTGSGLIIDEDFSGGFPAGWSVETNTNPFVNWTVRTPVPGGSRLDNLTGGSGQFAMADFGYATEGAASLRTPVLDLSSHSAAVLRFNSQHTYDTWESLNVDSSTDGGFNWTEQWTFQGFNPLPTRHVLDLSGAIAGEPSVMLRFRYDSEFSYSGDYWQIDDVELEVFGGGAAPGQAGNPDPLDGATGIDVDADLGWTAGSGADSHDVYFGTNPAPGGGEFQGNQAGTAFDPGTLAASTTYFWRIDEVNTEGTTTGAVWSFTTSAPPPLPGPATNPSPADGATDIGVNANLGWTAGPDADTHDVYFGTNPAPGPGEFQVNQAGTAFEPGTLTASTTYFWRIDEVNVQGTTTGTVWSFTTAATVQAIHLAGLSGVSEPANRGRWNAAVTVTVADALGNPVPGATAEGAWSNGATGTDSCSPTDANGRCTIARQNLKGNVASVDFTVTNLTAAGYSYNAGANEVPTTLTVYKDAPPPLPGPATSPSPADGATGIAADTNLGWTAGANAESHDVYFGTNPAPGGGEFQGNQAGTGFDPGTLAASTTYYWRIDEVNTQGTTTGTVWSFTTGAPPPLPGAATGPDPADGATDTDVNADLGWSAGADATSHDVYFGTDPTPDAGEFQGNQGATGFDPGTLATATTYYWRIDEVNVTGTTTGAVWSFTTGAAAPSILSVTATQGRDQGNKVVTVTWDNFVAANVDIYRNAELQVTVPNADGSWVDNLGKKPAAGLYTYEVCEQDSLVDCAQDSVTY